MEQGPTELNKNDVAELTIDDLGCDGEGVAHYGGKTIFVRGALKGERVRVKIAAVRTSFDFALLERVLVPSPDRISPPCPVFGRCGGCDLQHMSYPAQLDFKRGLVENALRKQGISAEVLPVVPSPLTMRYRNKVSLPVRAGKDGSPAIGLFARRSHRVTETDDCLLQYAWLPGLIAAVKDFMAESGLTGYDELTFAGDVREISAREIGGCLVVAIVATHKIDLSPLLPRLTRLQKDCELWLNVNARRDNVIFGERWECVSGGGERTIDGLRAAIHPAAFFQVNDGIRRLLYERVVGLCEGSAVIEAYSGAGLLSARLCGKASAVYGIEINAQAHEAALRLRELNSLDNFTPILGDVCEKLPALLFGPCRGKDAFLVVDPPRAGMDGRAITAICASDISRMIYVSCNPATLSRDLSLLAKAGFVPGEVRPYDMFPQTANVETLVVLSR